MAPTPGEDQKWFLKVARHIRPLLADFAVSGHIDHLSSPETISLISLLSFPSDAVLPRDDLYLRNRMAVEVGAREVLGAAPAIRGTLRGLQMMMVHAERGAAIAEDPKGARRKEPPEELYLVAALHALYQRVTGDKFWITSPPDGGVPGRPFVSFAMAVLAHICDNLDALEPAAPAALAENLKRLSTSPRRIGNRIRYVRRKLKGMNSSQLS